MFNQNAEYAFNLPCRRLAAVAPSSQSNASKSAGSSFDDEDSSDYNFDNASSSTSHRFMVGTAFPSVSKLSDSNDIDEYGNTIGNNLSIIEEDDENRTNRVYVMQYHEDSNELMLETSFVHPMGEIWSMACHPKKADWVATCGGGAVFSPLGEEKKDNDRLAHFLTTLWKTPDSSAAADDDDDYDDFNGTTISNNNSADSDDFWSENNTNNQESNRNRTASAASGISTSSAKLEPVLTIPHGHNLSSTSGWEQRVGQILWNPLLHPNSSSGDALMDLAETSSHEGGGNVITVGWDARSPITLWDISSMSEAKEVWSTAPENETTSFRRGRGRLDRFSGLNSALPRRASWDPHEPSHILATAGVDVIAYDMRCPPREVGVIRSAHRYGVTDVCHNHLQSNVVITSGADGTIKFFDLRMHLSQRSSSAYLDTTATSIELDRYTPPPLLKVVRGGHSHWAIRAACNPFYDQLILSGGTDAIANLWRISSCSSAPLLDLGGDEDDDAMNDSYFDETYGEEGVDDSAAAANDDEGNEEEGDVWQNDNDLTTRSDEEDEIDNNLKSKSSSNESNADIRVTRFECSDVTTDLTWSASDPWVYATLSCDGGLVVHHVPSKEKYKILL
mmetsp:Transcript_2417/g.3405  ORF Transcript_2417/g.3405 Transcript_2417/m.3405 type:complete len:619 (-) Transcript_2417:669-2525(-)